MEIENYIKRIENKDENNYKATIFDNLPDVFVILKYMLVFGIVFIIFLSFIDLNVEKSLGKILYANGNAMLIAGAFFGAGGFTGFLFGIPRIIQSNNVASTNSNNISNSDVVHNDNLVQISDWLTKIIVGVGLTQLYGIPHYLYRIGEKLGTSILGFEPEQKDLGTNVSIAIILYFSVLGFMMVYIWTRIYFVRVLKQADNDLKKELKEAVVEKEKIESQLNDTIIQKNELEEKSLVAKSELDAIISTFPDVTQTIKENQIKIRNDDDLENDPHKGKFGGLAENFGRKINAMVRETSYDKELFVVDLEVISTNPDNPLTGEVVFHLHPSFPNKVEVVKVVDGKAVNKLISYGAFTVGVEADNGVTKLELDLSELPDAPKIFRER